jgi:protein-tyrosine phosphatase
MYMNDAPGIAAGMAALQSALDQDGIALQLVQGADVHLVPEVLVGLRSGRIPTLHGSRYFLLEPSHHVAPPRFEDSVFELMAAGYVPVITHPERLVWIEDHYDKFVRLVHRGVWMQLTAGAILGKFGKRARYWSERMLDEGLVHMVSSDAHSTGMRNPNMADARDALVRRLGEATAHQLVQVRQSPEFEVVAPVTCQGNLTPLSTQTLAVQEGSITNYTWTFGDNTGSNQAAPVHLYPNPGTYLVTCTMVSSFGCIGVDQAQVLVVTPPQPDFTVANACVGTPFAFENLTVSDDPPADFVWTIGTIDQVFGESPSYLFASSGTVPVNLSVVTENGCEGSITRQVPVFDPPQAACTANPIIGAPPLDVDFAYTGSSANSFSWSINGEPAGESGALTATFNEEGSYTATVVSTNAEGCSASASITVLADQPVLDLVLTDFQVDEDGDGWSATVAFANAGNFSPTELSIRLSTADGNAITESPELIPQPGNGTVYSFAARLSPGRNGANYLCIELVPSSSLAAEATPANNRYCIAVSETFSFGAPYPNPSPAGTEPRVRFTLPEAEEARIRILDATGREVAVTESTRYPSGYNEVVLSGIQPPPGQYIIEFLGERHREIRRWQVLR